MARRGCQPGGGIGGNPAGWPVSSAAASASWTASSARSNSPTSRISEASTAGFGAEHLLQGRVGGRCGHRSRSISDCTTHEVRHNRQVDWQTTRLGRTSMSGRRTARRFGCWSASRAAAWCTAPCAPGQYPRGPASHGRGSLVLRARGRPGLAPGGRGPDPAEIVDVRTAPRSASPSGPIFSSARLGANRSRW